MAITAGEDAASVLEQFIHDVANLPAEITHLYEEMQAKDQQIQECRSIISTRDGSLQKFIKLNGSLVQNPKEEPYSKIILQNFDRAQILQEEKIGLSEKAAALLDRHVKRLDVKMRDLQGEGSIPLDPQMPSLLRESPGNLVPPLSSSTTGATTPLNPLSGNTTGGASIPHAAIARLANAVNGPARSMNQTSLQNMQAQALLNQQRLINAQNANQANARQEREMSAGSDGKRRARLNASLGSLPAAPSSLARQSSLGPGTPKPSTPGSRAGSVGPKPPKKTLSIKKPTPQQQLRRQLGTKAGMKQKSRKRLHPGSRASPSTTADDESMASEAGTEDELSGAVADQEDDEGDDTKYCFCQSVSYGDMVACDNEDCKYQWFHWECVHIKEEPVGDWLCPDCRTKPPSKIKRAR